MTAGQPMDAEHWHTWCTTPQVEEPPALTAQQWRRLASAEHESHVESIRKWLLQIYVETEELAAVGRRLAAIVDDNACTPPGAKTIVAVTGPYLIGKSTFMMRWGRDQYTRWIRDAEVDVRGRPIIHLNEHCEADLYPILWTDLPDRARNSTVDRETLHFCGLPPGVNNDAISISANDAVTRHRTRVMVLDDVHFLWLQWSGGRQVLDHIKHINTSLGQDNATLILVGANLEDTELVHDPQIAGRLELFRIAPYDEVDDVAQQLAWQRAVKQIEDLVLPHLPAGKPGMLYTQLAGELWYRSGGYLGYMAKLVVQATLAATRDGTHRILRKHVDAIELSVGAEDSCQERHLKKEPHDSSPRGSSLA